MPPNIIARDLVPLADLEHSLYKHLYPFDAASETLQDTSDPALLMAASPRQSPSSLSPPPLSHSESSSKASSTPEARTPPLAQQPAEDNPSRHNCQWQDCDKFFPEPETLYNHLCNDHIGRKSTGNLCLSCKWKDCNTSCAKRDHITSHLRVHTPLKPHVCAICKKTFKRPQDLKKHEKIHTEEHHVQHKHSKAITVSDPAYTSRVRGEQSADLDNGMPSRRLQSVHAVDQAQVAAARTKSTSLSASERTSGPEYGGLLPTPSPEMGQAAIRYPSSDAPSSRTHVYQLQNHQQLPTWGALAVDGTPSHTTGSGAKRTHDEYSMDDFVTDVKKRRLNPSYDPNMAARLNNLAYQHPLGTGSASIAPGQSAFNPRSVSFDIRSPEELAAVNEFLITLGRDVASTDNLPRVVHHHAPVAEANTGSFFDPASLSQLGLTGMPGIPRPLSGTSYHPDSGYPSVDFSNHLPIVYPSRASHQSVQPLHFSAHEPPVPYVPQYGTRIRGQRLSSDIDDMSSQSLHPDLQQAYAQSQSHYLTPPLDGMTYAAASPLSTTSTSSTGTPPHLSETTSIITPDGTAVFDYLRPSKPPPPIHLAPSEFGIGRMHSSRLLKTPPSTMSRPTPVEPKLGPSGHIRLPVMLDSKGVNELTTSLSRPPILSSSTSALSLATNGSLYPLLTSGDEKYKLAPLQCQYRSPSVPPSEPTSSPFLSRAATVSPPPYEPSRPSTASSSASPSPGPTVLPSIHEIAQGAPRCKPRRRESEELARAVSQIELGSRSFRDDPAQRDAHARLVRDLLVSINAEYRRKFGTPPPNDVRRTRIHEGVRDVEMVGA